MKAVGARNRDVMAIFLGEAASIGFLGGVIGAGLGWALSSAADMAIQSLVGQSGNGVFGSGDSTVVYTPLWLPIFAIVFATVIGLVSGVYPALRARNARSTARAEVRVTSAGPWSNDQHPSAASSHDSMRHPQPCSRYNVFRRRDAPCLPH